jgi:hypothetical protein
MGSERFRSSVLLIVLFFVAIQVLYAQQLALVMDEFDGAYEAYRLRHEIPYRDFVPYKTVLGYYVQFPATLAASTVWGRITALKFELIIINAIMLAAAAFYLSRFLSRRAVALALAMLAASTVMLERAGEIRVDMLTAWAGLWSFLFLIRRRFALAGALCAVSFAISQKAALYVIASNVVMIVGIIVGRDRRSAVQNFLSFNAAAAASLAAYLAFWSALGDPQTVLRATFLSASQTAVNVAYDIQWRFWSQVLLRNFFVFMIAGTALVSLSRVREDAVARTIALYAGALLLLCAVYTQPWPYFFVILFPTLFVLTAAFFDLLDRNRFPRFLLAACVVLGILYPLHRLLVVPRRSNDYQRYNVRLATALLAGNETYLAANDIVHDREQTVRPLSRLDAIGLSLLKDQGPEKHQQLIADLDRDPPKLVIGTYRIYNLPPAMISYVMEGYARVSGSVYLYAPLVRKGQSTFNLRFSGRYRIEVQSGQGATIDDNQLPNGTMIDLRAGPHRIATPAPLRLRLLPAGIEGLIDPEYAEERVFYPQVYD